MSVGICGTIHLPILALPPIYDIIVIIIYIKNITKKNEKKKR
jgi:hypothetical protein